MIKIKDNMTRSQKMAARKHNLNIAIKKMKGVEAKRPHIKLSVKEKQEARNIIRTILSGQSV